jgi:hypothetical protein
VEPREYNGDTDTARGSRHVRAFQPPTVSSSKVVGDGSHPQRAELAVAERGVKQGHAGQECRAGSFNFGVVLFVFFEGRGVMRIGVRAEQFDRRASARRPLRRQLPSG